MIPIAGYADRWSVGCGETIQFKVSSEFKEPYTVKLVRIICADPNPDGPGILEQDLNSVFSGIFPSRKQTVKLGSYGFVPVDGVIGDHKQYSVSAYIWPTLPDQGRQTIMSLQDEADASLLELYLEAGHLHVCINENTDLKVNAPMLDRIWYGVWCSINLETSEVQIGQTPFDDLFGGIESGDTASKCLNLPSLSSVDKIFIASNGSEQHANHYNGKIERLGIFGNLFSHTEILLEVQKPMFAALKEKSATAEFLDELLAEAEIEEALDELFGDEYDGEFDDEFDDEIYETPFQDEVDEDEYDELEDLEKTITLALWDFSLEIDSQRIVDVGLHQLDGNLFNCPTRAMKGINWYGTEQAWMHSAWAYGAIHFHEDDIYDCGWETDFEFTVPRNFRSAMYSMRIQCKDAYEDIPFYVRPEFGYPKSKICVLVPTFTYTVYSNQARSIAGPEYDALVKERGTRPWTPDEIRDFGLSTYNNHTDGSGICFSSSLRPSLTMRPNYITICRPYGGSGMRHLPADTHLLAWLEHLGYDYDVVTDHDLHAEGSDLLMPYRVVMTMSHPEYHTMETLQAIYHYSRYGGRLMYMGGNGFYWKVAVNQNLPGMVEIRRAEGGIRTWAAEGGEYYNALDGAYGGLWQRNGFPPQRLAGVGFTGQGDFEGTYYRKNPDLPSEYQWVFKGVDDEVLGDFGLSGGGAAGFELDRIDYGLGTPRNAVVLASSENYPDHFVLVPEEILSHQKTRAGDPAEKLIRADMVIFETPFDGYVFSVGSITYCGSLPWNGFQNNISKLTQNVLKKFLSN